jgi:hypothetical protein
MTRGGAETAVLTSAVVVGGIWAFRKVVEPATVQSSRASNPSQAVLKVIGAEPRPANTAQFAVAFGFVYVTLSTVATFAPDVAGSMAILVAVGELITNGAAVFTDILDQVSETSAGEPAGTPASKAQSKALAGAAPGINAAGQAALGAVTGF